LNYIKTNDRNFYLAAKKAIDTGSNAVERDLKPVVEALKKEIEELKKKLEGNSTFNFWR